MNTKKENRIWLLVTKKLAEEANQEELAELEVLLKKNPEINNSAELIFDWWNDGCEENARNDSYSHFQNIINKVHK